jgi:hypothetical protein
VHNCVNYDLTISDGINVLTGTQATFSVTFSSGGAATNGTEVIIQGQSFVIDNAATVEDGYKIKFNGLTDIQRATWLYNTLNATLFFDPSIVTVVQFGNVVTVTYNEVGQQSNWQFDNGGISQIAFYSPNGTDRVDLTGASYVWTVLQDRTDLSLPPIKLVQDRILPILQVYTNDAVPPSVTLSPQTINVSDLLKNQVATTLPNIYSPIFSVVNDDFFRKLVFMRAGVRYLDSCNIRNVSYMESLRTYIYNCLFQKKIYESSFILGSYTYGNKPLLIKDTYTICRSTSMFVWSLCVDFPLDVVYYNSAGSALETASFTYGDKDLIPTYMNVGGFGNTIPLDCAYYILNYIGEDSEVLHAVRINVEDCNCVVGEFIFLSDLGAYETITFSKLEKQDIAVTSDVINGKIGCTLNSLIKGGRGLVNTDSEVVYTMSSKFKANPQEIEFIEQFKRSQSFYLKYFFEAADSYGYIKIIPESINFAPIENGKANELVITFRLNQTYKSHPQNEGIYI